MKKLMFAAAVAAAGGLMAIESANVVGYNQNTLTDGSLNWICNSFKAIDGRLWTLADLIPGETFSASTLQFATGTGATKQFTLGNGDTVEGFFEYWREDEIDPDTLPDGASAVAGWYLWDEAGEKIYLMNSIQIPEGGCFAVQGLDGAGTTIGGAGQVDPEDTDCELTDGVLNWFGNCSPVDLTLGDLAVNANFSASTLQFVTGTGATKQFTLTNGDTVEGFFEYWREDEIDPDTLPDGATAVAGWYVWDEAGEKIYLMNSLPLPAGAGFAVQGLDGDGACVIVPSAL